MVRPRIRIDNTALYVALWWRRSVGRPHLPSFPAHLEYRRCATPFEPKFVQGVDHLQVVWVLPTRPPVLIEWDVCHDIRTRPGGWNTHNGLRLPDTSRSIFFESS